MASLYPLDLDRFRAWLADIDDMVVADLQELYDAAIALQEQVNVNPAGTTGTIYGRLFANGNISVRAAAWNRLRWNGQQAAAGGSFYRGNLITYEITFPADRFAGHETTWGEGVPAGFGAMQAPLMGAGSTGRAGVPWRSMLVVATEQVIGWAGRDGEGGDLAGAAPLLWGYILWNLRA